MEFEFNLEKWADFKEKEYRHEISHKPSQSMPLNSKSPESRDHVYVLCPASREAYCMNDCGNKVWLVVFRGING